ncbi:NAD(P)/FAD-dependent oxidoreductase [Spirosoma sp. KNUC1025]|uniref:NAD(P)/FAD-dependent oxidoreductase n=1 Tax=Spirosoma sp. KNUC1025 TaxID=2894082 RepID=UPI0038673B41|nr:FAD-dependent oxidoreductase [Spirosoma sp. KNUC1025]
MEAVKQVVLLGGGYVSIWAYRSLVRRLRSEIDLGTIRIAVVCPHMNHAFHGWTGECLTGIVQNKNRLSSLADLLPKALIVRGYAEAIDTTAQSVSVRLTDGNQQVILYDHLLVGIGSVDSDTITGIQTYGYQVKSPEGFLRTQQTLQRLVQQAAHADVATARRLLRFTVAGGGFAGVELVTNLAEYIRLLKKQYPVLQTITPQIRLVNSREQILPSLHPAFKRLIRYTEKTMRQYEIDVINNVRVVNVTEHGAYLSDGRLLESSMVISTIGQSRVVLNGTEQMARDHLQRLCTNPYQQINGLSTLWGGGDSCHVPHFQTGEACPANALWAIKHGEYAGRNIARTLHGKALKPFTYKGLGQAASLGLGKGISELYGFQFTGLLSWVTRWLFFHYFMPSRKLMLKTMGDWLFLAFRRQRKGSWTDHQDIHSEHFSLQPDNSL